MIEDDLEGLFAKAWHDFGNAAGAARSLHDRGLRDFVTPARVLGCPPLGVIKATREGDRFNPDPAGRDIFVTPERYNGETVDLVGFALGNPGQPATLRGLVHILGEEICDRQLFVDGVTSLWESPLSWLKSGCNGGVILDWSRVPFLLAAGTVVCESLTLARRVRMLFERPSDGPKLMVLQSAEIAA